MTQSKVISLNRKLKRKIAELERMEHKYDSTLREAWVAEDVLESQSAEQWSKRSDPNAQMIGAWATFTNFTSIYYHMQNMLI